MTIGPEITETKSCDKCEVCVSVRYVHQSDSGCDVYCAHPVFKDESGARKYIADTQWTTPNWCPAQVTEDVDTLRTYRHSRSVLDWPPDAEGD